jgi:ribonuclease T2
VDAQRIRQTAIGILILVVLSLLWGRSQAPTSSNTSEVTPTSTGDAAVPAPPAPASEPPAAGADASFDYYLLVLSWSPTHCSSDAGRGRDDDLQCRSGRPYGFVLHGFWPQNERGYPQNCDSNEPRSVADDVMSAMMKISPSADLIEHEWQKHGTCSGLSQHDYFAASERAFRSIGIPAAYIGPANDIRTKPDDVRQAFLARNATLSSASVAATCSRNELAEVWVCLDKRLQPRACSNEVRKRHCGSRDVTMPAVRGDWPR